METKDCGSSPATAAPAPKAAAPSQQVSVFGRMPTQLLSSVASFMQVDCRMIRFACCCKAFNAAARTRAAWQGTVIYIHSSDSLATLERAGLSPSSAVLSIDKRQAMQAERLQRVFSRLTRLLVVDGDLASLVLNRAFAAALPPLASLHGEMLLLPTPVQSLRALCSRQQEGQGAGQGAADAKAATTELHLRIAVEPRTALHLDSLRELAALRLVSLDVSYTNAALPVLAESARPWLRSLRLRHTMDSAQYKHLAAFPALTELTFCAMDGEPWGDLPASLQTLTLWLPKADRMTWLKPLTLSGIQRLTRLERLALRGVADGCGLSDLMPLSQCPALRVLHIERLRLLQYELKTVLPRLKSLTALEWRHGHSLLVPELGRCTQLRALALEHVTGGSDYIAPSHRELLAALRPLTHLTAFSVHDCWLPDGAILSVFAESQAPLRRLVFGSNTLKEEQLAALTKVRTLRLLTVLQPRLTPAARETFAALGLEEQMLHPVARAGLPDYPMPGDEWDPKF